MKKIFYLLVTTILISVMNSCSINNDSEIIGEWECVNLKESGWWYYYLEDGSQTSTQYYEDEYSVSSDHPEWYVIRFTKMFMTIVEGGTDVDDIVMNIPFTYKFKDNQLKSMLFTASYDHTDFVTVTFPDDNTMEWYIDDSGDMDDTNYGGYEDYKFWITFSRVK